MSTNKLHPGMTALITGAGSGLGYEFARQLSLLGINLVLVSKDEEKLKLAEQNLRVTSKGQVKIITYSCDLSDIHSTDKFISFVEANHIEIDLLINNAGKGYFGVLDIKFSEEYKNLINLNLMAPVILSGYFITKMRERGSGIILNIASTMAFRPSPKWAVYAATKSFIYSLTRSLQQENKNDNLLISVLCPGKINTDFDKNAGYTGNRLGNPPEKIVSYTLSKLDRGKAIIFYGLKAKTLYCIFKYFPIRISDKLVGKLT